MTAMVLYSILSVAGLGLVFGLVLAFAARFFSVRQDERIASVETSLPGVNCGACGFAGCASYAEAIVGGDVNLSLCTPGGEAVARRIAEIMGRDFSTPIEKRVTQVHCRGHRGKAAVQFRYQGVADCNALYSLYGGDKTCKFGCLNLGSCVRVCPVRAIYYDAEGMVWVNREKCISCGKCVDVCPSGVMRWVPYRRADYIVACNSTDRGALVRRYCSVGCIACKICEKKSPEGGYKVEDNLSRIDYTAKGDRRAGAEACPTLCIITNELHPPG
jgi:Na+-translocating ferredoxin:NAD+ oxidoreductase RNF subunit RnfB